MKGSTYVLLIGLLLLLGFAGTSQAQQQVMFTQYMFNGLAINPAYAGSHETISATALAREQWVGIDGAPSTQTFSVHAPLKKDRIAVGFLFMRDRIGITTQNVVMGSYAYRIPFPNGAHLSMGLQFGANNYNADFTRLNPTTANDPDLIQNDTRAFLLNFGAGLYYNTQTFYAGFSAPFLLNNFFADENSGARAELIRHYFATVGWVMPLNHNVKLQPSALLKVVEGAPLEIDLNANLVFHDVLWIGASYRSFDSVNGIIQFQLTNNLRIGYSYDVTTTELRQFNSGSHELMVNYRFTFNKKRIITPRYF